MDWNGWSEILTYKSGLYLGKGYREEDTNQENWVDDESELLRIFVQLAPKQKIFISVKNTDMHWRFGKPEDVFTRSPILKIRKPNIVN